MEVRYQVPIRSFVLEQLAVAGASGISLKELEPQLNAALAHIRDRIETAQITDPANTNNNLGESMSVQEKAATKAAAIAAIAARTWGEVFG